MGKTGSEDSAQGLSLRDKIADWFRFYLARDPYAKHFESESARFGTLRTPHATSQGTDDARMFLAAETREQRSVGSITVQDSCTDPKEIPTVNVANEHIEIGRHVGTSRSQGRVGDAEDHLVGHAGELTPRAGEGNELYQHFRLVGARG